MEDNGYKKYTVQARRQIRGEAFFESLVCDYSLPHRIVSPKDLGIDYICEWTYGDRPTGMLYAVQVKTFRAEDHKLKYVGPKLRYNNLDEYEIHNPNLRIDGETLDYWRGFGMPVYLFAVLESAANGEGSLDCYYKRFTAYLAKDVVDDQVEFYKEFYRVNEGTLFLAFGPLGKRNCGFARDLFIDHVRWSYYRGQIDYPNPQAIGISRWGPRSVFLDLFDRYEDRIRRAHRRLGEAIRLAEKEREKSR